MIYLLSKNLFKLLIFFVFLLFSYSTNFGKYLNADSNQDVLITGAIDLDMLKIRLLKADKKLKPKKLKIKTVNLL